MLELRLERTVTEDAPIAGGGTERRAVMASVHLEGENAAEQVFILSTKQNNKFPRGYKQRSGFGGRY